MKVQRRQVSFAKREPISFLWLSGCSLSGRSQQANRSASPAKRYLRWVLHGVPHRGKVYTIMPHIAYIALSLYLTFHQTLPELPPFPVPMFRDSIPEKGELRNHLSRALHYPAEVAVGERQANARLDYIQHPSFYVLMIPGLRCLQILMVVYIICRYRFSFSSSFLYFLLWLCRRLMADVGFCSRNLSVILSWLLYLNGLSFRSFSIGRSRYHSF